MAEAYGLPASPGMSEEFDVREYDEQSPVTVGPLKVEAAQVLHPVEAYALRVSHEGRALVYSGDTAYSDALVSLAQQADLLLAEAAFRDGEANPANLHMTGSDAGRTAARAGVSRLVLTHVPPWFDPQTAYDEARPVFDGQLDLASSGAVYEL
jgi:ribonuclease BN (tRNA processing enzyme)